MPQEEFVVKDTATGLYLISLNLGNASQSSFGNLENAIIFDTLDEAQTMAASIGPGSTGIPKPKH